MLKYGAVLDNRLDLLTQQHAKLAIVDIHAIELGREGEDLLEQVCPVKEVKAAGAAVVVVAALGVGEGLEDGERGLRIAQPEPGARQGLLLDARQDVAQERLYLLLFPRLRFHVDEVRLLAGRVLHAVLHEPAARGFVVGPFRLRVREWCHVRCVVGVGAGRGAHLCEEKAQRGWSWMWAVR